jgi:hypothetical protein
VLLIILLQHCVDILSHLLQLQLLLLELLFKTSQVVVWLGVGVFRLQSLLFLLLPVGVGLLKQVLHLLQLLTPVTQLLLILLHCLLMLLLLFLNFQLTLRFKRFKLLTYTLVLLLPLFTLLCDLLVQARNLLQGFLQLT